MSTEKIAQLNDNLRCQLTGGKIVMTKAFDALPAEVKDLALNGIRTFDDFNEENDPYGERNFGIISVGEHTVNWKIDYYDKTMEWGSDDPSNPDVTVRVLTLMLPIDN